MKKKAVLFVVFATIVISAMLGINVALAADETQEQQAAQESTSQIVEIPQYQKDGYKNYTSWKKALNKKHKIYKNLAKKYIKKYKNVISKNQKKKLKKYEKEILNSNSIKEINKIASKFRLVKKKAQYRKIASIKIDKYQAYISSKQIKNLKKYDKKIQKAKTLFEIQKTKKKIDKIVKKLKAKKKQAQKVSASFRHFMRAGIVRAYGYKFTYYSQSVLPGGGLRIPGRHVEGGFVKDKDGYICAAGSLGRGTIGNSPWGKWKLYDTGTYGNHIDIYVR